MHVDFITQGYMMGLGWEVVLAWSSAPYHAFALVDLLMVGQSRTSFYLLPWHRRSSFPFPIIPLRLARFPPLCLHNIIMSAAVAAVSGTEEIAIDMKKPVPKVREISSRKPEAGVLACPSCIPSSTFYSRCCLSSPPTRFLSLPSWSSEPWRA